MPQWLRVVEALKAPVDADVTVKGWLRTRRDSKAEGGLSFLNIHDGTCFDPIQVVATGALPNYAGEVAKLTTHCSVECDGRIVKNPKGGNEIQASAVRVIGWVDDPDHYPIQPKPHTMEFLREQAHLRARTNTFGAVARVRHALSMAIHRFYHERGFYYVHTPIITGSDCEGAGQMFRVSTLDLMNLPREGTGAGRHEGTQARRHEGGATAAGGSGVSPSASGAAAPVDFGHDFFGKETHLTVSGQLNVETYCTALSRVYTFGPTFRAENSNTSRHLSEFWMIEPEIAFANLHDNATLAEDFIKHLISAVLSERADDMKFFDERIEKGLLARLTAVLEKPFRHLPYTEGIKILTDAAASGKVKFEYPISWGKDLQSEHERYLTEQQFKQPVVLMNYPKSIKAFYMRVNAAGTDGAPADTVAAMDVLVPGVGEIIGGSQREERLEVLDSRINEMGLPIKEYWWYRDLRRYGTVPHAGFGLGFERAMMFLTGMQNVRDVIPFPRAPKQAEF